MKRNTFISISIAMLSFGAVQSNSSIEHKNNLDNIILLY